MNAYALRLEDLAPIRSEDEERLPAGELVLVVLPEFSSVALTELDSLGEWLEAA